MTKTNKTAPLATLTATLLAAAFFVSGCATPEQRKAYVEKTRAIAETKCAAYTAAAQRRNEKAENLMQLVLDNTGRNYTPDVQSGTPTQEVFEALDETENARRECKRAAIDYDAARSAQSRAASGN